MPVVFLQVRRDGHFSNLNTHTAYEGFIQLGYEICTYTKEQAHSGHLRSLGVSKDTVVFGGISGVHSVLRSSGIPIPEPMDYPDELQYLLGREIRKEKLDLNSFPSLSPVFIKPVQYKLFTGVVVTDLQDAWLELANYNGAEAWFSTLVDFETEYRVFVRNRKIITAKHYSGNYKRKLNWKIVEEAVQQYKTAPICYALDFGRTTDGRTLLVEANDFYALGAYGLNCMTYASCIADRWFEIVEDSNGERPIVC